MQVQRCLMCQRIYEGAREYGREVGTLEDAKCYGARQGVVELEKELTQFEAQERVAVVEQDERESNP